MLRLFLSFFSARLALSLKPSLRQEGLSDVSSSQLSANRLQRLAEAYGGEALFNDMNPNITDIDASEADSVKKQDQWDKGTGQPSDSLTAVTGAKLSQSAVAAFIDQISMKFLNTPKPGIYGEVSPQGMIKILGALAVRPGDVFYDLGSGAGKFPLVASNLFGMRAKGIELVTKRHMAGCKAIAELKKLTQNDTSGTIPIGGAQLVQGSFFDYDISDADVVFMNSVEWSPDMMERLSKMCKGLRQGAKIITFQKDLRGDSYRLNDELSKNLIIPTSWNKQQGGLRVYTKVGLANVAEFKGKKLFPTHAETSTIDIKSSCKY